VSAYGFASPRPDVIEAILGTPFIQPRGPTLTSVLRRSISLDRRFNGSCSLVRERSGTQPGKTGEAAGSGDHDEDHHPGGCRSLEVGPTIQQ
jgi:hypothetical protein